jgi:hypothetical protein
MNDTERDTVQFNVRIPRDLDDEIRAYAAQLGLRLGAVANLLLRDGLSVARRRRMT